MRITLPDFSAARVLVVGDIMLDRYWSGPTRRISPEAPVPVVKVEKNEDRPGGAANVALNVAALGGKTTLLGFVGQDEAADCLAAKLASHRVGADLVKVADLPTITKLRILSGNQQLIRLDFEDSFATADPAPLLAKLDAALPDYDVLILSDYAKGALTCVRDIIQLARKHKVPVLIDPKGDSFEKYRGATLIKPNMLEFETIVGKVKNEDDLIEKAKRLLDELDLEALLVTRSENGMLLVRRGGAVLALRTQAREVFDVTGAGDTVVGALATALSAGKSLEEACAIANSAAGVVVAKLGTSTVSPQELAQALHEHSSIEQAFGVMSEAELKTAVMAARRRGEKIVMTNGCFDILHAGHVSYLKAAHKLGDRLIVAVNTDDSVRRLKGEKRPIVPEDQRMAVLAALDSVDWVVPFSEDTPQRVIGEILPDLLVKGGDYQPEAIAGYAEVTANGGEVRVLHFEDGCSTSNIVKTIIERECK
ncbi:bifunctional D-glycero-beta-D-manno-heptose-7-phosphate kinase/D-glycero-beta-D-manno-heptose 1-phosphate adenylyltransferase HldE [Tolumonas lignilytica]|uniref:bifunctional D-glycero-beta-D-manno-heptose-7-phosphate kinase/D-glycero-beta-D-manno-heptose 1-phosphate adenylyltransferase HldE n=1 Tax=Tolumonas lignilytica TaxID=1283284 RepID=UPI000463A281|nr:bifunctional D-glycero-beta-D-manno-heptose-7-phosphate kinase/D-glycero-beta-D-manno-heptose 1-phosphate adenylyltransferase HldE [Tolumonas lignilytica]